ncbi:MAG: TIM barrel protein [Chloroflexi bacterium]|jgi:deoxyribonuclease IV|nr:TIM barrel protein [Chloroflexota bacterium]MBT7081558.1 TIM barrel protein [Chloroflexota bacterium]MBT7289020.1 TIM barrel protein [Chloroflexota bacterium]
MKNGLLFGTAGTPLSTENPQSTIKGIRRIRELGLDCMEMEFVRGVNMGENTARDVEQVAIENGIKLSAHAPYYINLNASDQQKLHDSRQRILQSARICAVCGASDVVLHAGFYLKNTPEKAYKTIAKQLTQLSDILRAANTNVTLRVEVSGKESQFGSLTEVLTLSTDIDGIAPCIDFAHQHAKGGKDNTYDEFVIILKRVEKRLGRHGLDNLHLHVSGVEYTDKGEKKHLNLRQSDFNYVDLLRALKDFDAKGRIICESPNLEEDAVLLKQTYMAMS